MKKTTLDEAIFEAKRFLAKAEALKDAAKGSVSGGLYWYPKEQGSVKRSSLDLTRKLADLRAGR